MAGHGMTGTAIFYPDGTDIDRRQCQRVVPMKVLVLGLCRTGTLSMRSALRIMGYVDTYHMRSASTETPRDCEMWMDAINAKYDNQGKPFGREEWDKLLGHCQAVSDFPAAAFAPELIAAYPHAKVILTNRDVDSWHNSCFKTIHGVVQDPTFRFLSYFDWAFRLYRPMIVKLWDRFFQGDFVGKGKEIYTAHYAEIRRLVPKEQLLEYRVEDGWEPLCKFLGEEIPAVPFPQSNTIDVFNFGAAERSKRKLRALKLKLASVLLSIGIVGVGVVLWK